MSLYSVHVHFWTKDFAIIDVLTDKLDEMRYKGNYKWKEGGKSLIHFKIHH